MKYFLEYNDYNEYNEYTELYEKNFITWLIKSRKFGDLFSLKKVVKISKRIAELDYTYQKRLGEMQKENFAKGRSSNAISIDDANELKSYEEEKINLNAKLEHKYGQSEFLMYTSETVKSEEELKYIKKRRKATKDSKEKSRLKKLESLTIKQNGLLKQQVEASLPDEEATMSLNDVEKHKLKIQKEKRDFNLNRLQNQKMKLQASEASAKATYNKNFYSQSGGQYRSRSTRPTTRRQTSNSNDNDIEIL